MCGIAGIVRATDRPVTLEQLGAMGRALQHRGPDGYGFFLDPAAGLAHLRLSIIDLSGGAQPLTNESGSLVITFNGEIYNYIELAEELRAKGHSFRTRSDTEVLVHAWEEWGTGMFERLNGQFSFGIYDRKNHSLVLARDRFGIRPLYYAERSGDLIFASEAKALFASGEVDAAPDLSGLDEVFTFWCAKAPRTVFRGVSQLPPGTWAQWRGGRLRSGAFWAPDYDAGAEDPSDALGQLDGLLRASVAFRMRADVPVGAYVSGGLDSTVTSALAAESSPFTLRTFSVTFADPALDESAHQEAVADTLASDHAVQRIGLAEIGAVFPEVVRFAETPLVRTAAAPMYLLAKLTKERGIKVVLTGEGSDEVLLGYDLFKETVVRRFCLRQPNSAWRTRLFDRLYPYLNTGGRGGTFWSRFFLNAGAPDDPLFSHMPRFLLTSRIKEFYSEGVRDALRSVDVMQELRDRLPPAFATWSNLERAAWLEVSILLPGYLLSSQGDRMAMAHGMEGRYPFLDHRLHRFASRLPTRRLLNGLREKDLLHRWASAYLPPSMPRRTKQPYRAPDITAFFNDAPAPEYRDELLDTDALTRSGLFDPDAVGGLVRRCRTGRATGFQENQALVGILSAQLWHHAFFQAPRASLPPLAPEGADIILGSALEAVPAIHGGEGQ
mgnify:CR=1 FL=1